MDKSFDFGKLLQLHEKKHKSKPVQFSNVAVGVKLRLDKRNNKRRSSRLTIFDKIRNIPKCASPVPPKPDQKTKLEHRMKQLQLWKQEKEKKKMEAALNKKKPFLTGVAHYPLKFVPPPPPKPMPSTSGRVTRSQTRQNTERAKTSQYAISNVKSFAPKNATFNPTLNIVKPPLQIPSSDAKKVTSKVTLGLKTDNKTKCKPLKSDFGKNKNNAQSKASDSSSSVGSSLPIAKTRVLRKRTDTVPPKKVPLTSESSGSLSSLSPKQNTRPIRKIDGNVKTTSKAQNSTPENSSSDDTCKHIKTRTPRKSLVQSNDEADSKPRTPRTSLPNSRKNTNVNEKTPRKSLPNLSTPVKPVPKSESSSEEKLRSPKQAEVPMTPEQIVELVQKLPSPCVTMSRGKDNARKEMKKKIYEGLLDDDVCEMDSLDHFKQQLDSEIKRMTEMCDTWDKISEQVPLPEAVQEAVLGAVGQARLLMSQKMQQFASLLARAECPEPGTALVTPTDLHGFWDMVFMQVANIDMRFNKLEEMRARNWADEPPPPPRAARRAPCPAARTAPAPGPPAAASRIKDLIAAKRKEQKQAGEDGSTEAAETKTFDAGFFSVRSPVRSPRAPTTPRRSLLHHVLSCEAKKASASKNTASYAMLRASSISKNVDSDDTMFTANQVQLTPVNLFATPARSILKSVNNKSTKKSGKKSIKMVLFNNSDTDIQDVTDTEKVNGQCEEGVMEESKQENRLASGVENTIDSKPKSKLIRQDAVEERSPVMTRSRRKSVQTPSEDNTEKTPRRTRRKHALQEIEVNIVEEQAKTPKRLSRRKSSIKE